jgi:hypothetical protein
MWEYQMYFNLPIIDGTGRSVLLVSMEIFKLGNNTLINYMYLNLSADVFNWSILKIGENGDREF